MKLDYLRARYFFYCLFHRNGYKHGRFLKKHNAFHSIGEDFFFQPYNLPADSQFVQFGNNVVIASNVSFICHDVIHNMLNRIANTPGGYIPYYGVIDVKDNVFIGANTTILANVTIGSNVIIAASSLVNKDIPDGIIVGGVPAKVIGEVEDFLLKRKKYSDSFSERMKREERLQYLWKKKEDIEHIL